MPPGPLAPYKAPALYGRMENLPCVLRDNIPFGSAVLLRLKNHRKLTAQGSLQKETNYKVWSRDMHHLLEPKPLVLLSQSFSWKYISRI